MPYFLLTSTTYGAWLPGNHRGSVTSVRDRRVGDPQTRSRIDHNGVGQACEPSMPGIYRSAKRLLNEEPVWLTRQQACLVRKQLDQTARRRGVQLLAGSIMPNHFHLVVAFHGWRDTRRLMSDFKAHASRALNESAVEQRRERWWTRGGSKRRLPDERALHAAKRYVLFKQPGALVTWSLDTHNERTS